MKKSGLLLLSAIVASTFSPFSKNASAMILPPNDWAKYDNVHRLANMTEQQFNQIADYVINLWQPYAEMHHAKLSVVKKWNDSTVNAYAEQRGDNWMVTMFGGLARRPEITADGFALVVCHELGHHFGGYYFYEGNSQWASAEGQADYFATQVCAHKVFEKAPWFNAKFRQGVPPVVQQQCDGVWKNQPERDLCYRSAAAGFSLANLLAGGAGKVKFETPDPRKVPRSNTAHPQAQCRLDTYFSGALCPVEFDPRIIPGKGLADGQNSPAAEALAAQYSCMQSKMPIGVRPLCWFKPLTGGSDGQGQGFRPGFGPGPGFGPRPGFGPGPGFGPQNPRNPMMGRR